MFEPVKIGQVRNMIGELVIVFATWGEHDWLVCHTADGTEPRTPEELKVPGQAFVAKPTVSGSASEWWLRNFSDVVGTVSPDDVKAIHTGFLQMFDDDAVKRAKAEETMSQRQGTATWDDVESDEKLQGTLEEECRNFNAALEAL